MHKYSSQECHPIEPDMPLLPVGKIDKPALKQPAREMTDEAGLIIPVK